MRLTDRPSLPSPLRKISRIGQIRLISRIGLLAATNALPAPGQLLFHSLPDAHFSFGGVVNQRIEANLQNWLLRAPAANPGMLEMFRLRDRQPAPQLVPWAGEFAGKYLISAVQALRMTDSPELRAHLTNFVAELLATQAGDGYLGPFPRAQRLLGNWDLWGHYHVMEGLLLWHAETGDVNALRACRRAADLICRTYLDQPHRVLDAGSPEMNMAVIHVLGALHRLTGEPRYRRMMAEIEKDWERSGDYLRAGVAGTEFFASPRPRWESLHDLQGLVELWQITGQPQYRDAFTHHWRSIARWDVHNHGGFSSGEQATGNPYSPAPVETCCTVAWMALSLDMLRLTGDPRVADALELSTFNAALGAQHPSGRWWTYNTPMDGVREASAHSIVFQARAGTPELNCCSVNGPRALGMLSDWVVMQDATGLILNWHGPAGYSFKLGDGKAIKMKCDTDFPWSGRVLWSVDPETQPRRLNLRFRIPEWSATTGLKLNGESLNSVKPGSYYELDRVWTKGDVVELNFDLGLRYVAGDREAAGKVSLYRGPILLAYDQRHNPFDEADMPVIDVDRASEARVVPPGADIGTDPRLASKLLVDLPTAGNRLLRLCDFASAGALGTHYHSWLPATNAPPPPPIVRYPADGAVLGPGRTSFRWTTRTNANLTGYRLILGDTPGADTPVIELKGLTQSRVVLDDSLKRRLTPSRWYYWRVVAGGPHGETTSAEPRARFLFNPSQPSWAEEPEVEIGPGNLVVRASLRGTPEPEFGHLKRAPAAAKAPGPDGSPDGALGLNGQDQMLIFSLPEEFSEDYSVALRVRLRAPTPERIGQIFSAWAAGMDDPLRLTFEGGQLFARIESGQGYSTKGVPLQAGAWHHVAAVKAGAKLSLYLDGTLRGTTAVPASVRTSARTCALGGNPNFSGNEFLAADFADFALFLRALSEEEIKTMAALGTR